MVDFTHFARHHRTAQTAPRQRSPRSSGRSCILNARACPFQQAAVYHPVSPVIPDARSVGLLNVYHVFVVVYHVVLGDFNVPES